MTNANSRAKTYKVFTLTQDFVIKHPNDYENLVALQSKQISPFIKKEGEISPDTIEGIVRIQNASNKCKCIYRKAVGAVVYGLDSEHAMLSARSMKQLDVQEYDELIIKPANWFCYLWNHYDSTIRHPFRVAIIIGLLSIGISLISLLLTIINSSCCCCN